MKNNKGFTLIEILAAVTILGILSVLAVTSIQRIIDRNKVEYYKTTEKNIVNTAQSYAQANRKFLPKRVGEKTNISLKEMIDANYIDEIKDYNDKICNLENSYVQIFKYSKSDYSYLTYLDCPGYTNTKENNNLKPNINVELTGDSNNVSKTEAKVKITDSSKLLSYQVIIFRNGKEIYNTGNTNAEYEKVIDITHNISKYTPGTIKVIAEALNIYGNKTTVIKEKVYADKKAPVCVISNEDKDNNRGWTNSSRKITVGCDDGPEGVGCTRETFTKTFKESTDKGFITIKDKAGNETKCSVVVHVDKIKPTCSVTFTGTKGDNNWYKSDVNVKLTISDKESGTVANGLTTTSSTTYNGTASGKQTSETAGQTWYGYVKDKAGNVGKCEASLKMDKTNPTCSVSKTGTLGNNDWYRSDVSLKLSGSDNLSGLANQGLTTSTSPTYNNKTTSSQTSETSNTAWYGYVKDKAGNTGKCNTSVKIDKTKPTCTISLNGTVGSNSWYTSNVGLKLNYKDGLSGIAQKSLTTLDDHEYYNNSESDTDTRDGTGLVWYGYLKDNAGNTNYCSKSFKADKTPPTNPKADGSITISGSNKESSIPTASGATDSTSGIKEYLYLVTNSSTKPSKTDNRFSSNRNFTRSCGTSYYGWAVAVDNVGNRSDVISLGSGSDGPDVYTSWGSCDAPDCGSGYKYRTNHCALVTSGLKESCGETCYHTCLNSGYGIVGLFWVPDSTYHFANAHYNQKLKILGYKKSSDGYNFTHVEVLTNYPSSGDACRAGTTGYIYSNCVKPWGQFCSHTECIP